MSTDERKTAIVTGAPRGIGAAIAQRLASHGFNIIINFACLNTSRFSRPAAALIAAAVFLLDTLTTLDIAIAVLYVLVVLLSLNFATQTGLVLIGAGCMGLTVLGFLISHGEGLPAFEDSIGRCFVSLAAIGITTFLAFRVKAAISVLAESEQRYRTIFRRRVSASSRWISQVSKPLSISSRLTACETSTMRKTLILGSSAKR